ncbi:uncharacterized protein LOC134260689 [Saccostrea cucullata]|uniref:uncharacterized protein LOC134260689 n=1 Tax=Saccostrea cuccullata TaxID=36930 RepID=UPI002ED5FD79
MATNTPESVLGSPQEHIPACDKHSKRIDMFCEDCDEFICSKCAKTKHKDHNWDTLSNVASQRREELLTYLTEIKNEDIPKFEEKKEKILTKERDNKIQFENDIRVLQKHFDNVIRRLTEIKKSNEKTLKNHLSKTNEQIKSLKSQMDKKKSKLVVTIELIENNGRTMSDFHLIDNLKMLKQLRSNIEDIKDPLEYGGEKVFDDFRQTWSIDAVADEVGFFQNGDNPVRTLEVCSEDICYIQSFLLDCFNQINIKGKNKRKFMINLCDICVCKNGEVFFTDNGNNTICQLFPLGSVSVIANTEKLLPLGICESVDGGLLVALTDYSEYWEPFTSSVRHMTLTGDVIYEIGGHPYFQEQLFSFPQRIAQNGNSDICVVDWAYPRDNLTILSTLGQVKCVYHGGNVTCNNFDPYDVACDSFWNILVTDATNHRIHLLSPSESFLKFLLTKSEMEFPTALSLYKSKLWIGNTKGLVKVFRYKQFFSLQF